jgi:DNA invertase Pin-like site-specific DNA recombinase
VVAGSAIAYSYVRFSSPKQAEGDSLRRQTDRAADWCARNGVRLDTATTLHDLGTSAYTGAHRKNPDRNALAAFLKLVEQGRVPRGSYLIVESLDRLSREHIRPALALILNLIEAGVKVVQLIPIEAVYDDRVEPMQLMMAIMELSRGNSESRVKSERIGDAWRAKKERARASGEKLTAQLPAWVEEKGGRFRLVPDRAKIVRRIFSLTAAGYGITQVARTLTAEGVTPFGTSGKWNRSYIDLILRDRRAVGEYQPKEVRGDRRIPDGDPIPGYYPAVVTEDEWLAARAATADRARLVGRGDGGRVNLFRRLVRCALDGSSYVECLVNRKGVKSHQLHNSHALEGRGKYHSFPAEVFEAAILSQLREVDPREVLGADSGPDDLAVKAGELTRLEGEIGQLEAELADGADIPSVVRVLKAKEARRAELAREVADLRHRAAHPLAESWGELRSLAEVLAKAKDPADARLRLRAAVRRVVESVWLLPTAAGAVRPCVAQVYFAGGAVRSYLIAYRPAHGPTRRPATWQAWSLVDALPDCALDLRDPADVREMELALAELDLTKLAANGTD